MKRLLTLFVLSGCTTPQIASVQPVALNTVEVRYGPGGSYSVWYADDEQGCRFLGLTPAKRDELESFGINPDECFAHPCAGSHIHSLRR